MKRLRPSPALVVSVIALTVAMGGTGYAALKLPKNSVGNKQLRKNAVTGAKVKNGSLTGKDLKVNSLPPVPIATSALKAGHSDTASTADSAATATTATNADNADTVSGQKVRTFTLKLPKSTAATSALELGGLQLKLACDASGEPTVTAFGLAEGAMIRGMRVGESATTPAEQFGQSQVSAGGMVEVFPAVLEHGSAVVEYATPDGHVVSANLAADDSTTIGGFEGCSVSGSAVAG